MEEEFNNVTLKDGGRYIPKYSEEDMLILDKLSEITRFANRIIKDTKCLPSIYVDIINNDTLNASAILNGAGKYFIGINKGTIIKLNEEFNKAVNNDLFFKRFNMKKENKDNYKEMCLKYALEFIIAHEISHIRYGHLKINKNTNLGNSILYEAYSQNTNNDYMLAQTLEFDADCCGISTVLNRILVDNQKINNTVLQLLDMEERLFCLSFAVNYINELFFQPVHNIAELDSYDHPHPGLRQFDISATTETMLLKVFNGSLLETLENVELHAMIAVEKVYHGDDIKKENMPLSIFYTEKGQRHNIKIQENWKNVREALKEHSFDELAPYKKINFLPELVLFR